MKEHLKTREGLVYILEGNIGSGKSTLLHLISLALPEITIVQEPVESWHKNDTSTSLLHNFYANSARWGYTMEHATLLKRVKEHLAEQESDTQKIMERSLYSGFYCFAKNGFKTGYLTKLEWKLYQEAFEFLVAKKCKSPQGFIYLDTAPELCHKRVALRSRSGEDMIPLSYLEELDARHKEFLVKKEDVHPYIATTPVLHLDGSREFYTNKKRQEELILQIQNFVAITQLGFERKPSLYNTEASL